MGGEEVEGSNVGRRARYSTALSRMAWASIGSASVGQGTHKYLHIYIHVSYVDIHTYSGTQILHSLTAMTAALRPPVSTALRLVSILPTRVDPSSRRWEELSVTGLRRAEAPSSVCLPLLFRHRSEQYFTSSHTWETILPCLANDRVSSYVWLRLQA